MIKQSRSTVVEAALAGLLAAALVTPAMADHHKKAEGKDKPKKQSKSKAKAAKGETVKCMGVNACKGKSECGVEGKHGCAGHNACKGQGWVSLAKKGCEEKGGTALAGAGMAAAMTAPAEKVECHGVNACKGQGECGGEGHGCAGNNACKGKGWVALTKADCEAKGGKAGKK